MPTNAAGPVLWETERLIAREWSEADAEAAFEMYGDIEVMRGLSGIVEADLESQGANLRKAIAAYRERPRGTGYWALVRKEDGRIVGASLVKPIPGDEEKIEIGWHLAKAHWGKGYATEAARAILEHPGMVYEAHSTDYQTAEALGRPGRSTRSVWRRIAE